MISIDNLLIALILVFLLGVNNSAYSQCYRYKNAQKDGLIIKSKSCFKNFAVLLQDTCTEYNRFTNNLIHPNSKYDTLSLASVIIDVALLTKTEELFCANYQRLKQFKSYFRLYIGCIDNNGDTCIIVQFIKETEFYTDKRYMKQLNLILGGNNPLLMAYFVIKKNDILLLRENVFR